MKKVLIIHGFEGMPNGGWRPWLMGELEKLDVYACALPMPAPDKPVLSEWVGEIARQIPAGSRDEFFLVGHSLGVPAILRYLEQSPHGAKIEGALLVSGFTSDVGIKEIVSFVEAPFDFATIKKKAGRFAVIHGSEDDYVPLEFAESLARDLGVELTVIPGAGHFTGSEGWKQFPLALEALRHML